MFLGITVTTSCSDEDDDAPTTSASCVLPKASAAVEAVKTIQKFMDHAGVDLSYLYKVEGQIWKLCQ